MTASEKRKLGELRRSQVLYGFGVGAVLDLPHLSAIALGLHRWDGPTPETLVTEDRLLAIVRAELGGQVERLCLPPVPRGDDRDVLDPENLKGVPVAPFPRWLRCPKCELLASVDSGHFQFKHEPWRPDRSRYEHPHCPKARRAPTVTPARFVLACPNGHVDDFPWHGYLGCAAGERCGPLKFQERGVSAEVADLWIKCEGCNKERPMVHAFGENAELPGCPGRHPHLGKDVKDECKARPQTMLVGASNSWFPITRTALSLPRSKGRLQGLVEKHWAVLETVTSPEVLAAFRKVGNLDAFHAFSDEELWEAVETRRRAAQEEHAVQHDLKVEEWETFSRPDEAATTDDFRLREVEVPAAFRDWLEQVVLVEKLRVVRALTGFTRIVSPGDYADPDEIPEENKVRLSRALPTWVPAAEVRGEGIFLQFREDRIREFVAREEWGPLRQRLREAHAVFRKSRKLPDTEDKFPDLRYTVLHGIAHLLIRQFAIECGYAAASVAERIYSKKPEEEHGPMAGILLYTAASDSEGTLGGLVALGCPENLKRHLLESLRRATLCSSDPLCAEHEPETDARTLHGAACHACMFVSETSCERGNKYLDRNLLVPTVAGDGMTFFPADLVGA